MQTEDLEKDLKSLEANFDFSNLEHSNPLFSEKSKSRLFKFKEEMSLKPILRYVGLASKVYCLQIACCRNPGNQCGCVNIPKMTENSLKYSEKLVCKGSSRFSMNNITFQDYMSCLERQEARYVTDYRIVSENQILITKFIQKKAFSGFDDKRYILECGIHSEPFAEINNDECYDPECIVQKTK